MNNDGSGLLVLGILVVGVGIAMIALGRPLVGSLFLVTGSIRIVMGLSKKG
jgi:hypothetical protein